MTTLTDEKPNAIEIIYTWPDGTEEVRYRKLIGSIDGEDLRQQVEERKRWLGDDCPYSWREVFNRGQM